MDDRAQGRRNMLFMISSLYGGGAEKVCCLIASGMAERHNVTILTFFKGRDGKEYPLDSRVSRVFVPYRTCPIRKHPLKWLANQWINLRSIRAVKKEKNIDVSVSFLSVPNALNVFSRRGERVVTSERANPKLYEPELFRIVCLTYALSDHVVFQSERVRSLFGKRIRARSSIIMNPVTVACRAAEERNKRVVSVGRLAEQKNHSLLIRSFAAFHRRFGDYSLSIYGEGAERDRLQALIDSLGLSAWVELPGNTDLVHERIRDAEIFVLSSNFEGLSNALLECMTMGIACISTRCEGSTDVIRDGENGLLVDIGDEDALTEAMCRLAADPDLRKRLEREAMKDAEAFDDRTVIKSWEKVFFNEPGESA
jgi:glycosyltransferase involved in cell wall biosynthesis